MFHQREHPPRLRPHCFRAAWLNWLSVTGDGLGCQRSEETHNIRIKGLIRLLSLGLPHSMAPGGPWLFQRHKASQSLLTCRVNMVAGLDQWPLAPCCQTLTEQLSGGQARAWDTSNGCNKGLYPQTITFSHDKGSLGEGFPGRVVACVRPDPLPSRFSFLGGSDSRPASCVNTPSSPRLLYIRYRI